MGATVAGKEARARDLIMGSMSLVSKPPAAAQSQLLRTLLQAAERGVGLASYGV